VSCVIGLGDNSWSSCSPMPPLLRRRFRARTVKDVPNLPAWPYCRLRIVIQRRALIEVVIGASLDGIERGGWPPNIAKLPRLLRR
jgi:hypothetical protein